MTDRKPDSRITLVTGGTGGLGRAVVRRLLERGDRVSVPWIAESEADVLRNEVADLPDHAERLSLVRGDVTDAAWLLEHARRLEGAGGLDVLLNLVGGFDMAPIADIDPAHWDRMMGLNARTAFLASRTFVKLLRQSKRAAIVNVASAPAVRGEGAGMAAYTSSKGAVISLTKALASELRPDGITVNAVAPTTIDTEANRAAMPDADRAAWVTTDELAALFEFLTGEHARHLTGNVVVAGF